MVAPHDFDAIDDTSIRQRAVGLKMNVLLDPNPSSLSVIYLKDNQKIPEHDIFQETSVVHRILFGVAVKQCLRFAQKRESKIRREKNKAENGDEI